MKNYIKLLAVCLLLSGCAIQHVDKENPETKERTRYTGIYPIFTRNAVDGLQVDNSTKGGTSTLLKTKSYATQTDGEALGTTIGTAAKILAK